MYLSTLLIDTGTNPDRHRPGRLWLRNLYRVHQRLCMAFPSPQRIENDPYFIKPYIPFDFPEDRNRADEEPAPPTEVLRQVHTPRNEKSGFLFRVDPLPGGKAAIVILSAIEPNWSYAFSNAMHLLAAIPDKPRQFQLSCEAGTQYRFHLVCNPTKRPRKVSSEPDSKSRNRVPCGPAPSDWLQWLERKTHNNNNPLGFNLCSAEVVNNRWIQVSKNGKSDTSQRLLAVRYKGTLEVVDPDIFYQTVMGGIGPAKAFGMGLLSIAPV